MKKLKLKALSLGAREILSREQLRSITGGDCSSAIDCAVGQLCDENKQCADDPNGPSGLSGFGSSRDCQTGTPDCICNGQSIGCMTESECNAHVC